MELGADEAVEIARTSLTPSVRSTARFHRVLEYPDCFSVSFAVPASHQPFPALLRIEVDKTTKRATLRLSR